MLTNLLAIIANEDGNFYFDGAVRGLGEALIYALIGFLIVFLGIVIIIAIIWLIGLLMRKTNNFAFLFRKRDKKKEASIPATEVAVESEEEIPDDVKAAIVAALMAYYVQEQPKCEFKVKRIKKI